ncbi:hypothetical protein MRB53_036938 [Persea americana]|nr:hypothetical protein MRB53_036938 [Persea americana]
MPAFGSYSTVTASTSQDVERVSGCPRRKRHCIDFVPDTLQLLSELNPLLLSFIGAAEQDAEASKQDAEASKQDDPSQSPVHSAPSIRPNGVHKQQDQVRTRLTPDLPPNELVDRLRLELPEHGSGVDGVLTMAARVLNCSVNTWQQGFLDKLYASTNAVGVAAELLLAVLNTNVHVYKVAPALTVIEKQTAAALARKFGFSGPYAGGVTQPGGSAANLTALVTARNTLFPEIKTHGLAGRRLVLFTSAHGHYSFEKAAQVLGMGSAAARPVAVDDRGCMRIDELQREIQRARSEGLEPFFVNATAGTTVLGSYDPFVQVGQVCEQEGLWFHIDGSWGGSVIFSDTLKGKVLGADNADSITVNPHKMLGVPVTCSFLLAKDLRRFHRSNTLPAAYLFHEEVAGANQGDEASKEEKPGFWDLADLTLQCGRKGDALKMALAWNFYGSEGFAQRIDNAFAVASQFATLIENRNDYVLVSSNPPPCLQVCFYYAPQGLLDDDDEMNSRHTKTITKALVPAGFLLDHAPGPRGLFFRVVVNLETRIETLAALVQALAGIGARLEPKTPR